MKTIVFLFLLNIALCYEPISLIPLNENNVQKAIEKYNKLFVIFHAKWCGKSLEAINRLEELGKSSFSSELREKKVSRG